MKKELPYTVRRFVDIEIADGKWHTIPHWIRPCHMKSMLARNLIERKTGHSTQYLCDGFVRKIQEVKE